MSVKLQARSFTFFVGICKIYLQYFFKLDKNRRVRVLQYRYGMGKVLVLFVNCSVKFGNRTDRVYYITIQ